MTMSEVAGLRKHKDHLIMSFAIQAIVNICKSNYLIIFFLDVNPHASSFRLTVVKESYGCHLTKRSVFFEHLLGDFTANEYYWVGPSLWYYNDDLLSIQYTMAGDLPGSDLSLWRPQQVIGHRFKGQEVSAFHQATANYDIMCT